MLDNILSLLIFKAKMFLTTNPFAPIAFVHQTKDGHVWQIVASRVPELEKQVA